MHTVPRISPHKARRRQLERHTRRRCRVRRWALVALTIAALMLQGASIHTIGFAGAIVFFLATLDDFRDEMDAL